MAEGGRFFHFYFIGVSSNMFIPDFDLSADSDGIRLGRFGSLLSWTNETWREEFFSSGFGSSWPLSIYSAFCSVF